MKDNNMATTIELSWVKYSQERGRSYSHSAVLRAFNMAGLPEPQVIAPATMIARISPTDIEQLRQAEQVLSRLKVRYRKDMKE